MYLISVCVSRENVIVPAFNFYFVIGSYFVKYVLRITQLVSFHYVCLFWDHIFLG